MKKKTTQKSKRRGSKASLISSKRWSKSQLISFAFIFAAIGSFLVWNSFASTDRTPRPFIDKPEHGLIWAGLKAPQAGSVCGRLYEVANSNSKIPMCTHGPDPAPEGVDVRKSVEPVRTGENDRTAENATITSSTAATSLIPCDGDGSSGKRVQGLYVRASDVPSRLTTFAESLQTYAARANNQYLESAQQTNGERHIRWVHDATCRPIISEVVISPDADDTFGGSINALQALGYNRNDRKYMMWVDAGFYCGIGTIYSDDDPESDNLNNGAYATYARSDSGCWGYSEAHELMHNLGGVQPTAPHATKGWHCTDEADEMCYVDGSGVVMTNTCPYTNNQSILFDCNHDDYYYAGIPPIENYLSSHWNTANSGFLVGGVAPPPVPTQCSNGRDDDGDTKVDLLDPGCSNASDNSEYPDPVAPPPPPGDTTAPTVSISKPLNGDKIRSNVTISAMGSDSGGSGFKNMELYIDGVLKNTFAYPSIVYKWSAGKASSGPHTITLKAYDNAGNDGQSSVTVFK